MATTNPAKKVPTPSKAISMSNIRGILKKPSISGLFQASSVPDVRRTPTYSEHSIQNERLRNTSARLSEEPTEETSVRRGPRGAVESLIGVMNKSCAGELDIDDFRIRSNLLAKLLIDECDATGVSYETMRLAYTCAVKRLTQDMELEIVNWEKSLGGIELKEKWENAKVLFAKTERAFHRIVRRKVDGDETLS